MTAKKLTVGSHLESWCTKCKEDRDHVVESVKTDGAANKVRCGFCEGSHLYRAPKGAAGAAAAKKPAKAASKAGGKSASPSRPKSRGHAITEVEKAKAKPYGMDKEFAVGDVLVHVKFGFGRVTALKAGGKMEVVFEGGPRMLICKDIGSLLLKRPRGVIRPVVEVPEAVEEEGEAEAEPAAIEEDSEDAAAAEEEE